MDSTQFKFPRVKISSPEGVTQDEFYLPSQKKEKFE